MCAAECGCVCVYYNVKMVHFSVDHNFWSPSAKNGDLKTLVAYLIRRTCASFNPLFMAPLAALLLRNFESLRTKIWGRLMNPSGNLQFGAKFQKLIPLIGSRANKFQFASIIQRAS